MLSVVGGDAVGVPGPESGVVAGRQPEFGVDGAVAVVVVSRFVRDPFAGRYRRTIVFRAVTRFRPPETRRSTAV